MNYSIEDLVDIYQKAGIHKYNNLFVTTGLAMLGIPKDCKSTEDICQLHIRALRESCPNTNLIIPSYSYSFYSSNTSGNIPIFDRQVENSKIGPFANYVIRNIEHERSIDPMVSVLVVGKNGEGLLNNLEHSSYGKDSIFGRLLTSGKTGCLSIGLGTNWTPFIHYLDERNNVEYRYNKIFMGKITGYNDDKQIFWNYSVPIECEETDGDCRRLGYYAEAKRLWQKYSVGKSMICIADYAQYYDFAVEFSKKNLWCTARGPKNIYEMKNTRNNETEEGDSLKKLADEIRKTGKGRCIELSNVKTGSVLKNYIVPERLEQHSLIIESEDKKEKLRLAESNSLREMVNECAYSFEYKIRKMSDIENAEVYCYNSPIKDINSHEKIFSQKFIDWYIKEVNKKETIVIKYKSRGMSKRFQYLVDAPNDINQVKEVILVDTSCGRVGIGEKFPWSKCEKGNKMILYGDRNIISSVSADIYEKKDVEVYEFVDREIKRIDKKEEQQRLTFRNINAENAVIENEIFVRY